ncbi:protein BANP-like isoform X1 [Dendronephthya gigantea]|uniref:protein BANP-like isoform X1 n=2 Tax=Dendronephthya gigantea TaxID=151771 RepID=UPI00106A80F3|nr:protein BANP-like isoform X1 [Dendronephthya gigantea]
MAWKYTALQEKLSSIQTKLAVRMENKSDTSDQVMNLAAECLQDNQEIKTVAKKRKAEDFFVSVDNSKSSRLMLDMYTQTDNSPDICLKQIYELVKTNSENIQRIEDMVTKLCNIIGEFSDGGSGQVVGTPEKKTRYLSPVDTRPQLASTQYQGVSNTSLAATDYVTQVPQQSIVGNWEGSQLRSEDITMNPAMPQSENGLTDVITTPVKTPPKVNWNGDSPGNQLSGTGCWLGDPNNANSRAWFSGDPKIITKCENYGLNPVKLALALTEALFTREEMAASNVRGTRGKESLDSSKIKAVKAHVDYKFPLEEDRMELRWQLIKPKIDSKCRSQRRLQREHKWKMEKLMTAKPEVVPSGTPRSKRLVIGDQEREMLLYGVTKTVVSVYAENNADTTPFTETQEGYLPVNTNQ